MRSWAAGLWVIAAIAAFGGLPCHAADHAVIMTISNYEGVPALPGVRKDAESALKILTGIGFRGDDTVVVDEKLLTLAGMRQTLTALSVRIKDDDRVFVYFSGHGTSYVAGERCEQALVPRDLKPLSAHEMFRYLTKLGDRAAKVVVVLDSCFSGGVAAVADQGITRSLNQLTPKYVKAPGGATDCSTPVNLTAAELQGLRGYKGAVNLERNYVYVAAARDNEVAFDDSAKGGVATSALVECLASQPADADHSGSVSFGELASCAQGRINARSPGDDQFRQHIVVTGNDALPVAVAESAPSTPTNPVATLKDLLQGADARFAVVATASSRLLKLKKDSFTLNLTSKQDGFLYILYVGSDQHEFQMLYPTTPAEPNSVRSGVTFTVPRIWHSEGPVGIDHVLVLVTSAPRDFTAVFGAAGSVAATNQASSGLQTTVGLCRNLSSTACPEPATRNLSGKSSTGEGTTYGAALITVEEHAD